MEANVVIKSSNAVESHSVTVNYKKAINDKIAYGRYMILKINGVNVSRATTLSFMNANVDCGRLQATYSVALSEDEWVGSHITGISLSGYADGSYGVIDLVIEDFVKENKICEFSITVFLKIESDKVLFTCGDNKLARFFLGDGLNIQKFDVKTGYYYAPNVQVYRDSRSLAGDRLTSVSFTEGKIVFDSPQFGSSDKEILLLGDGQPVLRSFPFEDMIEAGTFTYTPNINGLVSVMDFTKSVSNVTQDGKVINDFRIFKTGSSFTRFRKAIKFKVSPHSYFKADMTMEYLAIVSQREILLLKVENDKSKIVYRLVNDNYFVDVLVGGIICLWGSTLKLYEPINGKYEVREFELPIGENPVITREGSDYHIATIRNNQIYRYRIDTSVTLLDVTPINTGAIWCLFRDNIGITYCSTADPICAWTLKIRDSEREEYILSYLTEWGDVVSVKGSDGVLIVDFTDYRAICQTGKYYVADCELTDNLFLYGSTYILQRGERNTLCLLDYVNCKVVSSDFTLESIGNRMPIDARSVGGYTFLLFEDGTIENFYLDSSSYGLTSREFSKSKVTLIARYMNAPKYSKRMNITFNIEIV